MNPSPPTAGSPVTLPRLRYPLAYRLPLSAVQRIMTNTSTATCLVPGLSPSPFSLPRVQAHLRIGNDWVTDPPVSGIVAAAEVASKLASAGKPLMVTV